MKRFVPNNTITLPGFRDYSKCCTVYTPLSVGNANLVFTWYEASPRSVMGFISRQKECWLHSSTGKPSTTAPLECSFRSPGALTNQQNPIYLQACIRFNPQPQTIGDSTSNSCVALVKKWMDTCSTEHVHCSSGGEQSLPLRVLDIGTKASPQVRLRTTDGESGIYACLSHCWGRSKSSVIKKSQLDQYRRAVPWDELDKTYQDATLFCRQLSIRYLWIDSLCILQDDRDDWRRESVKMAAYYKGSVICISATSSADHT